MSAQHEELAEDLSIDELFAAIDNEVQRLTDLFANADWSGSTLYIKSVYFQEKGKHWWNRTQLVRYKMMPILQLSKNRPCRDPHCYTWHPTIWIDNGYLRSDGTFFFWGERSRYRYVSPRTYLTGASNEEIQRFLSYIRQCQEPRETRIDI